MAQIDLVKKWCTVPCDQASSASRLSITESSDEPVFFSHRFYRRDTNQIQITRCCIKQNEDDTDDTHYSPGWVLNDSISICMSCESKFNYLMRGKHHCRACGNLICYKCSKTGKLFGKNNKGKYRICVTCYEQSAHGFVRFIPASVWMDITILSGQNSVCD